MFLKNLKEKALQIKNKALDYSSEKLASSTFTINSKESLEQFIDKSKNTTFKNQETWEESIFKKRVFAIFIDEKNAFFKQILILLPVLLTKSFTQNTQIKLIKSSIENLDLTKYSVKEIPSLVVFENKEVYKVISWEENILKLVKSFDLDINKQINIF